jgi:ribosomal protein S18 acetylase RimI-like enzyme
MKGSILSGFPINDLKPAGAQTGQVCETRLSCCSINGELRLKYLMILGGFQYMSIQKATLNELDSLTELFDLYRLFYGQKSNPKGAMEFLKERLINEESVVFIAFDENNPVGFVQLYPLFSSVSMKRSWVLNDLYMKENARRKGFAEKLIKKAINFAKETGSKGILLETGKENLTAQRLYEKIGFTKDSNSYYYFSI